MASGSCVFIGTIMAYVITFGVTLGVSVLILWLVFITNKIKFHVIDAELTQFNFTDNHLQYNLHLYMAVRNPNERIGIYYDTIEATAMYKGQKFDRELLRPFYQGQKTTSQLKAKFEGQRLLWLAGGKLAEFNTEKLAAVYAIDVKLHLRIRLKFGVFKIVKVKPQVDCRFRVPLTFDGRSFPGFHTTGCHVDY